MAGGLYEKSLLIFLLSVVSGRPLLLPFKQRRWRMQQSPPGGSLGSGPELLRNFHLRLHLQLLPAADLQLAAERKQLHLKRLLKAAPPGTLAAASSPGKDGDSESRAVQALLRGGEQREEADTRSSVEVLGNFQSELTGVFALPSYRLHVAASLHEDLERLGWGEGLAREPVPDATSGDAFLDVAVPHHASELEDSACKVSSTNGATRETSNSHPKQGEEQAKKAVIKNGTPNSPATMVRSGEIDGGGALPRLNQQLQLQHRHAGAPPCQTNDSDARASLATHPSNGNAADPNRWKDKQPTEAELMILKEQLATLQLQLQQQQHECASSAAAAAALRLKVQQLLEENKMLRLRCHGARNWESSVPSRGPPLPSAATPQPSEDNLRNDFFEEHQHPESPQGAACTIKMLHQTLAICRRELMILSEQNARLKTNKSRGPPSKQR